MTNNDDYILFNTYFDKAEIERVVYLFEKKGISYTLSDRSNPTNYRVPSSTYIEVDILVRAKDFEIASDLTKGE